jgi:hypothetical protein
MVIKNETASEQETVLRGGNAKPLVQAISIKLRKQYHFTGRVE